MMRAILVACLLCLSVAAFAGQPDAYSAGVAAYKAHDYTAAFADFRLAAKQGNARAQNNLGDMYFMYGAYSHGASMHFAKGAKWYRLAAKQGDARAQNNLGGIYAVGQGVQPSEAKSMKWYRLAAKQGFARAQNHLGDVYFFGHGVPRDFAKAVKWYRLAAQQGNANGQNNLGYMYRIGQGVPQSYVEAYKWTDLALAASKLSPSVQSLASTNMRRLDAMMTSTQIAQAQQEASAWWAAHHEGGN